MRKVLISVTTVLVLLIGAAVWLNAAPPPTVGSLSANPAYIVLNTPTAVIFSIQITEPTLMANGVNLLRTDVAGKTLAVVGVMRDDGANGDATAGDRVFSHRANLNETVVGQRYYRASAAFKGVMQRSLSNIASVTIDPFKLPPDPGDAGKQTLAGIDSDTDGVRDDVQRFVAFAAATDANLRSALTQLAITDQTLIQSTDSNNFVANAQQQYQALACLLYRSPDHLVALRLHSELKQQILNTDERADAYLRANSLLGGQFIVPPEPSVTACQS